MEKLPGGAAGGGAGAGMNSGKGVCFVRVGFDQKNQAQEIVAGGVSGRRGIKNDSSAVPVSEFRGGQHDWFGRFELNQ